MTEHEEYKEFDKATYNIIKRRGSPDVATTLSGDIVYKKGYVVVPSPFPETHLQLMSVECADYHMEHFVYIDPNFAVILPKFETKNHWFAMCTCGSAAVIISPSDSAVHDGQTFDGSQINKLVCLEYMNRLTSTGVGSHVGQDRKAWQ